MTSKIVVAVLVTLALIAGAVGVGAVAFNAGVAQGLAQSGNLAELAQSGAGIGPHAFYGGPMFFHRPFGFGFGFLGCLVPLLFLFLAFSLVRGIMWRRHWGWGMHWGGHGPWGKEGAPPMFEEWHRRAHGAGGDKPQEPATPQS